MKQSHDAETVYYETIAKTVLENTFPGRYRFLNGRFESPDLRNEIGNSVEVTRSFYTKEGKASGMSKLILNKNINEVNCDLVKRFERLGYQLLEYKGKYVGYGLEEAIWSSPRELIEITEKKIKKLELYGSKTDLFIFSPNIYDNEDEYVLEQYADWCKKRLSHSEQVFHHVYVFDFCSVFDYHYDEDTRKMIRLNEAFIKDTVERIRKTIHE